MSHVVSVKAEITDLEALEAACGQLGLELVRDQRTYRWYGRHVGDYPLPQGFTVADMGQCDHAIRVRGLGDPELAYEIGVCRRRDGRDGWTLLYDFYGGQGRRLEQAAGPQCRSLVHEYAAVRAARTAAALGYRVEQVRKADGSIGKLVIHRGG